MNEENKFIHISSYCNKKKYIYIYIYISTVSKLTTKLIQNIMIFLKYQKLNTIFSKKHLIKNIIIF